MTELSSTGRWAGALPVRLVHHPPLAARSGVAAGPAQPQAASRGAGVPRAGGVLPGAGPVPVRAWLRGLLGGGAAGVVWAPTTWTVLENDGPNHLGLRCNVPPCASNGSDHPGLRALQEVRAPNGGCGRGLGRRAGLGRVHQPPAAERAGQRREPFDFCAASASARPRTLVRPHFGMPVRCDLVAFYSFGRLGHIFGKLETNTAELSSGMPVQFPQHSDAIRNIYHPTPRSVLTACCPFANGVCHGGGGCSTRTGGLGRSCRYESRGLRSSDFNMLTPYNQPPHKFARKKGPDGGPLLRPIRRASPPPPPPLLPACSLCSRRPAPLQARRGSRGWRSVCSTRAAPARGSCSSSNGAVSGQSTCGSCPPTTWTTLQQDGPDHLGLWYNALPDHQMALITSDCRPKFVRVRTWWCRFTTPAERAETGQVMAHSRNPCGQSLLQL